MKYIVTSKTSNENHLIDDEVSDFQKNLLKVIQSSIDGPFSV